MELMRGPPILLPRVCLNCDFRVHSQDSSPVPRLPCPAS
jgi:hypothetical protein